MELTHNLRRHNENVRHTRLWLCDTARAQSRQRFHKLRRGREFPFYRTPRGPLLGAGRGVGSKLLSRSRGGDPEVVEAKCRKTSSLPRSRGSKPARLGRGGLLLEIVCYLTYEL